MNNLRFEDIEQLDSEGRYDVFLSMVEEEQELWILVSNNDEFLKLQSDDDHSEYLPIWPHADFTNNYCEDSDIELTPKNISIKEFCRKWVPGLRRDGLLVSVCPNGSDDVWLMEPTELKEELQEVLGRRF